MDLQVETSARALGLDCGALTVDEIVAWADSVILNEPDYDLRLLDLSLAKTRHAAMSALEAFGRSQEASRVARRAFGFFHAALMSGQADCRKIAFALYLMTSISHPVLGPQNDAQMESFYAAFDPDEGVDVDIETVKADMLAYLHANME
ncbi:MAG: hypothetical protein OEU46_07480 [Alphaproteobacteria bacterium]|nr:hypothetical protein [Alphaproteobacteria bacterium]